MFFELLKTAEQTATEQREVVTYKEDDNNVKICKKLLINLAKLYNDDSIVGLYAEPIQFQRYSDEIDNVAIYRCFTPCIKISTIYNEPSADSMQSALQSYNRNIPNYTAYIEDVKNTVKNGGFIGNDVLYLLQLKGDTELYKNVLKAKQEQRLAEEKAELERAKKKAEEERRQKQAEAEVRERRHAEKVDFLMGYTTGKSKIQTERIYNILSKTQGYREGEKVTYKSRRDFIKDIISEGGKMEQKDGVISYYGSRWDVKQSKPKTEYRAWTTDGTCYTVTKTEYDFGNYLISLEE